MRRQIWIDRLVEVERLHNAARVAAGLLRDRLSQEPGFMNREEWTRIPATTLIEELEKTFLVRIYAVFESGLRDYWKNYRGKSTRPQMRVLLLNVATYDLVPQDWLDDAVVVQLYRNILVHDDDGKVVNRVSVSGAKKTLCRFFSRLPDRW
jgi:hypothetical protein